MVKAKQYELWNMSVSMLFGVSPKITFKCGTCSHWSSGRASMANINRNNGLLIACPYCGETNKIPCRLD